MSRLEWKREWSGEDAIGFNTEISSIRALREKHGNLDLRAENVRKICLSFDRSRSARIHRHRTPP